jgi:hypothetical protein
LAEKWYSLNAPVRRCVAGCLKSLAAMLNKETDMHKLDLTKQHKDYYTAKCDPKLIEFGKANFLTIVPLQNSIRARSHQGPSFQGEVW